MDIAIEDIGDRLADALILGCAASDVDRAWRLAHPFAAGFHVEELLVEKAPNWALLLAHCGIAELVPSDV